MFTIPSSAKTSLISQFKPLPELDEQIKEIVKVSQQNGIEGIPLVTLGSEYTKLHQKKLNQVIATAFGIQAIPGLSKIYLDLHPGFSLSGDGNGIIVQINESSLDNISSEEDNESIESELEVEPFAGSISTPYPQDEYIEHFSFVQWPSLLQKLEKEALPESWGENRSILWNKICMTFQWLYREYVKAKTYEEKCNYIYISKDQKVAIINVGLVDRKFNELYLVFSPNKLRKPYWYAGEFSVTSRSTENRIQAIALSQAQLQGYAPQWPCVLPSNREAFLEQNANLNVPPAHLVDRLERFPFHVLRDFCQKDEEVNRLLEDFIKVQDEQKRISFITAFKESEICQMALQNGLDFALSYLRKRLKWNYKTAVPAYYPRFHSFCFLVPLTFLKPTMDEPDVVLVLSHEEGGYIGRTILTPQMAYSNARLICRPESEWLTCEVK